MTDKEKLGIQTKLVEIIGKGKSASHIAKEWSGVSTATISQVVNNNWGLISDEMWRLIGNYTGYYKVDWVIAETSVQVKLNGFFMDAKERPVGIRAIVVNSSLGKSTAVERFWETNNNTYYVRCHRLMNIRVLMKMMLKAMGKSSSGTSMQMLDDIVSYLAKENKPLFIIDEVDKLRDEVLEMFVDIENKLNRKCGLVFLATPYMKRRIESGVSIGKRGFTELYSRMKKKFIDLTPDRATFKKDVAAICTANGITDEGTVIEFSNKCEDDFRVLNDLITAFKRK